MTPTPPDTPSTSSSPEKKRSMMPLILILVISLAPVVFALLAYYVPSLGLRPDGTNNYGTLIDPQRPMPDSAALPLTDLQGNAFDLESLRGQWLLVTADDAACPESCVRKLFILRNSHASQGKEVERLSRIWFVLDDGAVSDQILEAYRGTHMLRTNRQQLARFLTPHAVGASTAAEANTAAAIDTGTDTGTDADTSTGTTTGTDANTGEDASASAESGASADTARVDAALKAPMWIIDPLGNLMMAFPPDADPLEVRDDIRKLLRTSRIG